MDVDRVAARIRFAVPGLVDDLHAGDDTAGPLRQHREQVELTRGQHDGNVVTRYTAPAAVDHEIAHAQKLVVAGASGEDAQPGEQLVERERLRQVVVDAGVEAADA